MDPITNRPEASVPPRQDTPVQSRSADTSEAAPTSDGSLNGLTDLSGLAAKAATGPDLRADEIERAKRLVADPNYPSDEILDKLAEGLLGTDDFRASL